MRTAALRVPCSEQRTATPRDAMEPGVTTVANRATVVPITDREVAERFSAVVIKFPAGELASPARRSKQAAKSWKSAAKAPSAASLINMARQIPEIRAWVMSEIEGRDLHPESEQALDKLAGALLRRLEMRGRID